MRGDVGLMLRPEDESEPTTDEVSDISHMAATIVG